MDLRAITPPLPSQPATPVARPSTATPVAAPAQTPDGPADSGPALAEVGEKLRRTTEAVAAQLQEYLRSNSQELEFHVDANTETTVITVRDAAGEVVRQIPNEDMLRIQRFLTAQSGTLLDVFV